MLVAIPKRLKPRDAHWIFVAPVFLATCSALVAARAV